MYSKKVPPRYFDNIYKIARIFIICWSCLSCNKKLIHSENPNTPIPQFKQTRTLQILQFINTTKDPEYETYKQTIPKLIQEELSTIQRIHLPQQTIVQNKESILRSLKQQSNNTPSLKRAQQNVSHITRYLKNYTHSHQKAPPVLGIQTHYTHHKAFATSQCKVLKSIPQTFKSPPTLEQAFTKLPQKQADLFMIGVLKKQGKQLLITTSFYDPHNIQFILPKKFSFNDHTFSIQLQENTQQIATAYTQSLTQFPTGTLTVKTTPTKADTFLNNRLLGQTNLTLKVPIGKHKLKVTKPGYKALTKPIFIIKNTGHKELIPLQKETTLSALEVHSSPSNAEVYLDLTYQGTTPLTIKNLKATTYKVRLEKKGYQNAHQHISLKNNHKEKLFIQLSQGTHYHTPLYNKSQYLNITKHVFLYSTLASLGVMLYSFFNADYYRQKLNNPPNNNHAHWDSKFKTAKRFRTIAIITTVSFLTMTTLFQILELHTEDVPVGFAPTLPATAFVTPYSKNNTYNYVQLSWGFG